MPLAQARHNSQLASKEERCGLDNPQRSSFEHSAETRRETVQLSSLNNQTLSFTLFYNLYVKLAPKQSSIHSLHYVRALSVVPEAGVTNPNPRENTDPI